MSSIDVLRRNEPLWGEWNVCDSIGSGVQSQVFMVSGGDGERCALKVVTMGRGREQQETVREQVLLTRNMGQMEGLVPCLRTGEFGEGDDRVAVMLMPLLVPLSDILMEREEDMSSAEVLSIARDLCQALVVCRTGGVIHRDIKPANVFADGSGKFYLGDLGVARNLEHTMLATRKGTPAYMSPEIASGRPCSYSSDVYSLGVMLYQLLNGGRLPLLGRDARYTEIEEAVSRRLSGEPLPLPENACNRLGQLVCEMCDPDPHKRPSAQQCLEEITELSRILEEKSELPPVRRRADSHMKLRLLLCGGAALLTVLALALVFSVGDRQSFPAASSPAVNAFTGGGVADDGQWLYLGSDDYRTAAYRVSGETGERQTIYDGSITHLNLCEERIFFIADHVIERAERLEDGKVAAYMRSGVRSMAHDGTDEQILCRCETPCAVEYGGWVYHYISNLGKGDVDPDAQSDESDLTFSQIMRVKADGSAEEALCRMDGVYVSGLYVYRDRIYLVCADYTGSERAAHVLSLSLDGTDSFRVVDGQIGCFDFLGDCICYTTNSLTGSVIMKKPLDGSGSAEVMADMPARQFAVYGDRLIICTPGTFGSAEDSGGVFLCDAGGKPISRLLDRPADSMALAGDILVVKVRDGGVLAVNIEDGETAALGDFCFELY